GPDGADALRLRVRDFLAVVDERVNGTRGPDALALQHRASLARVGGDGRYHNHSSRRWLRGRQAGYAVEAVNRPRGAGGWVLPPKRWVVERAFAWLGRYRQPSKDYDYNAETTQAWVRLAALNLTLRRLAPDKEHLQPPFKYAKPGRKSAC